ncbi:MAG: uracil-DNA glycosylase [Betaproteobacteria bacterium]|nr:uracil-DNA glycosylase [Betaproteobacteria bacterium]
MKSFNPSCTACPRLAGHLREQRLRFPTYFNRPVPAFGAAKGALLVVGLAPGLHGANRTGRPFTGDHAGILLYETLHEFGFASHKGSAEVTDGLQLKDCRITNAVKCLPPKNKPESQEVLQCNAYLAGEIHDFSPRAILALGVVAHNAVLRALDCRIAGFPFRHGARHSVDTGRAPARASALIFDSYHCSRYNTQTRRLTPQMFKAVFSDIARSLAEQT